MKTENSKLTLDKLKQLFSAASLNTDLEQEQIQDFPDAIDYDWQKPHYFKPEHLEILDAFAEKISHQIEKTFLTLCHGEFTVSVSSIEQYFAKTLCSTVNKEQQKHYFLTFNDDQDKQCGFLSVSLDAAVILIGHMLRDSDTEAGEERKLTLLEESILMDFNSALLDALDVAFVANVAGPVRRDSYLTRGRWPLDFEQLEDLTSITITVENPDGSVEITFTMLSKILEDVVGIKQTTGPAMSPQKSSNIIMQRMHEASVTLTAQLAVASICLNDVMNLESGDLLMLGKKTDEPIELLVNNNPCFTAYPAQSKNRYAVVIAQREEFK